MRVLSPPPHLRRNCASHCVVPPPLQAAATTLGVPALRASGSKGCLRGGLHCSAAEAASTPLRRAASRSTLSRMNRRIAYPAGSSSAGRYSTVRPDGAQRRIAGTSVIPSLRNSAHTPRSWRMGRVAGVRNSPHGLSRGKRARSRSSTSQPRRAISSAADEPAGPPPTTITSRTCAPFIVSRV